MGVPVPARAAPLQREPARERILRAARGRLRSGRLPTLAAVARDAGMSRATLYRVVSSRSELLRLLEVVPDPSLHERIVAEAVALIGEHGLARLSMDELAERAGVSRASLYRLFPGKAALFREVVRAHTPFVPLGLALAENAGSSPELLMPLVARTLLLNVQGRVGLFRALLFEVSGSDVDADLARELALSKTIAPLAVYVASQMSEGRLRPMDPVLALQAFAGPLIMHLITRDITRRAFGFEMPLEAVADELAGAWLRAMAPEPEGA